LPQTLIYEIVTPADVQEQWDVIEHSSGNLTILTRGTHFSIDASGGALSVFLPAAADNLDRVISVKKIDSSANAVTVDGNGSETIDGVTTKSLASQYDGITVISNGTSWEIVK
jgi:hypothetical protein